MRKPSWAVVCGLCVVTACGDDGKSKERADAGDETETDAGDASSGTCDTETVYEKISWRGVEDVDVLFVVDNSPSMIEEQENLAKNLHLMVESLASGEIKDENGKVVRSFPPVKSLHLAVTTTNMGLNGAPTRSSSGMKIFEPIDSCDGFGDDGLLLDRPDTSLAGCDRPFPKYLEYPAGSVSPTELGDAFGCIARTGSTGCGFEQQLEAAYKALAPSSNKTFHAGSAGHGDAENAGFLRSNSVVTVILVSDEEDSSSPDTSVELFNALGGDKARLNLRQYENAALLHPTARYVDGLRALRPENPDLVIFAGIVGVPKGVEGKDVNGVQDFDLILKQKEMQFVPTPKGNAPNFTYYPNAACVNPNVTPASEAYPGPRYVEVAKGFGKNGVIRSICDADYSGALTAVIDRIAGQLEGPCFARELKADSGTGLVECGLVEYLAPGATASDCSKAEGRRFLEMRKADDGKERVICQINQLKVDQTLGGCDDNGETKPADCLAANPNPSDAKLNPQITSAKVGWYYDDFSAELQSMAKGCNQQWLAFTAGAEPKDDSELRLECAQPAQACQADAGN